jgi:hypothetical protein
MTPGDRVCVLRDGRLQQADMPQALFDAPVNLFAQPDEPLPLGRQRTPPRPFFTRRDDNATPDDQGRCCDRRWKPPVICPKPFHPGGWSLRRENPGWCGPWRLGLLPRCGRGLRCGARVGAGCS